MNRSKKRNPLIFEELEPRLLLSADLAGIAVDLTPSDTDHQPDESDLQAIEQALQSEQALVEATESEVTSQELVIIDPTTPDYQSLVDDLISQNGNGRSFEIVLLDSAGNGIEQIDDILNAYQDLDAVHILSHGSDGGIQLGDAYLNLDSLSANASTIESWHDAFSEEGDLLIYGCDLAASEDGQSLVEALARLTGADVAASDDLTGHEDLGGDWDLEHAEGVIETEVVVSEAGQRNWSSVLATDIDFINPPIGVGTGLSAGTVVATDPVGGTIAYSLVDDAGGMFSIDSGSGELFWSGVPDTSTMQSYDITVRVTDSGAPAYDEVMTITTGTGGSDSITGTSHDDLIYGLGESGSSLGTTNYVTNGSFESGGSPDTTGWSVIVGTLLQTKVSGTDGVVSTDGSYYLDSEAPDGNNTFEQTISGLTNGNDYQISFDAADAMAGGSNSLQIYFGGVLLDTLDPNTTTMQSFSYNVTADSGDGTNELRFVEAGGIDGPGTAIDNVRMYEVLPSSGGDTLDGGAGDDILIGDDVGGNGSTSQSLTINDAGFEDIALPDGGTTSLSAAWTDDFNNNEVFIGDPSTFDFSSGAPAEGENALLIPEDNQVSQTLASNFNSGNDYELSLQIGNPISSGNGGAYSIQLYAGGTLIGSATGTEPASDTWVDVAILVDGEAYAAADGSALRIVLSNTSPFTGSLDYFAVDDIQLNEITATEAGDDTLTGGAGDDYIDGGAGTDTAVFSGNRTDYTINYYAAADELVVTDTRGGSPDGTDTLINVEILQFSDQAVTITDPSAQFNDAPVGLPTITGTATEDQTLTADTSGISDADGLGTFSFQWLRDSVAITGATDSTYTLGDGDVGTQISIEVSYTDGQGTNEGPLTSAQTAAVLNINDIPLLDSASLSVTEGQTVTLSDANFGITDPDDSSFTYTVSSVTGGYFQLSTNAGVSITTFTSTQLSANEVQFVDDGNEMAPDFDVTVNDGEADSNTLATSITYTAANDAVTDLHYTQYIGGGEFLVNTITSSSQDNAEIVTLSDGSFVVVWESYDSGAVGDNIRFQRYDSDGNALGVETLVNTTETDAQKEPQLSALNDGGFVIVWQSDNQDSSNNGIFGRIFNADGSARTGEFQINTFTTDDQADPHVATLSGGDFVVVWESSNQDGSGKGVYSQRYDASGNALGTETQVHTATTNNQSDPKVSALSDGGYIVVWESEASGSYEVKAQQFDAAGGTVGAEFQINTTTSSSQDNSAVALLTDGSYVVVWESSGDQDGDSTGIFGQLLDNTGTAVGSEFQINSTFAGAQLIPVVIANDDGGFFVAWQSPYEDGGTDYATYVQQFDASANKINGEILINEAAPEGGSSNPALTLLNDGRLATVYQSYHLDGVYYDVFGRIFTPTLNENTANGTVVAIASQIVDPDSGDTHTFTLLDDAGGAFGINTSTGAITVADTGLIDFEIASTMNVTVRVTDGGGLTHDEVVTIAIQDVNETPTDLVASDSLQLNMDGNENDYASATNITDFPSTAMTYEISFASTTAGLNETTLASYAVSGEDNEFELYTESGFLWVYIGGVTTGNTISNDGLFDGEQHTLSVSWESTTGELKIYIDGELEYTESSFRDGVTLESGGTFILGQEQDSLGGGFQAYQRFEGDIYDVRIYNDVRTDQEIADNANSLLADPSADPNLVSNWQMTDNGAGGIADLAGSHDLSLFTDATFGPIAVSEDAANGTHVGYLSTIDPDAGDTHTYSLVDNAGGAFAIDINTGQVTVANTSLIDYETATTMDITVRTTDAGGLTYDEVITITIKDANEAPVGLPTITGTVTEDQILTADTSSISDDDGLGTFSYQWLRDGVAISGETASTYTLGDADVGTQISVEVSYTDGNGTSEGPLTSLETTAVTNVNDAPNDLHYTQYLGDAEFIVNTHTTDVQNTPDVVTLANGDFVVVWESANQDGDLDGVYFQRYDANGVAQGVETLVNTTTTDDQDDPQITALSNGGFAIVWEALNQDGDGGGIYGRIFDASGLAVTNEFLINTTTANDQYDPHIAALDGGGFVVVWESNLQDGDAKGIYSQHYDNTGVAQGGETQVHTTTTGGQNDPRVSRLNDGGYIVVWDSNATGSTELMAQRFDASGVANGTEFQVNTTTSNTQDNGDIAALSGGGFVIVWESWNQDGDKNGIYGQRFDAAGNPSGSEFLVNTFTSNDQTSNEVIALEDGSFIVAWYSFDQDGDSYGVYAQQFDASGNKVNGEFQINTTTANSQAYPTLTLLQDGRLVVVYESDQQDGSGDTVVGRIFTPTLDENSANGTVVAVASQIVDPDSGDTHTFTLLDDAGGAFGINTSTGAITVADTGLIDYETASSVNVTVRVTDSGGLTHDEVVTIAIINVDEYTPVANADNISVAEGGTATSLVSGATDVLSNDTGLGDTPVTISLVTGPTQSAAFTLNTDGTFSYTHNGSENFTDSFTYRVTDNDGQTSDATVTINITPVSDATPVAVVDSINVAEGGTATTLVGGATDVLSNDTGLGDTPVTVSLVTGPTQSATFTLNGDGTFSYTHNGSENFTDSFTYRITDNDGQTSDATVTINITPVSDQTPVAVVDTITVAEGATITTLVGGSNTVLNNDTGLGDTPVTVSLVTGPTQSAAFTLNTDGTFSYTHNGSENFTDSFVYRVTDNDGQTSDATVTINVTSVSDTTPVANADAISVAEGGTATTLVGGSGTVLNNDTGLGETPVTVSLVTDVSQGSLTLNSDGTFSYTHDGSENLTDSFTYRVTDNGGETADATVTINVVLSNNSPIASEAAITLFEDTVYTGNLPSAVDHDGDTVIYLLEDNPLHGSITIETNGVFSYTPDADYHGADRFRYSVNDGNGGTNSYQVAISVISVNDQPVITSHDGSEHVLLAIEENSSYVTTVSAEDYDHDPVSFSIDGGSDLGLFSIDSVSGELTFDPVPDAENPLDSDQDNLYQVQIQVSDGNGGIEHQMFTIEVRDVDEFDVGLLVDIEDAPDMIFSSSSPNEGVGITAWAEDLDNSNSLITYSLDDNANGQFVIDPSTGIVSLASSIGNQDVSQFEISVRATSEDGSYSLHTFHIELNSVIDTPPESEPGPPLLDEIIFDLTPDPVKPVDSETDGLESAEQPNSMDTAGDEGELSDESEDGLQTPENEASAQSISNKNERLSFTQLTGDDRKFSTLDSSQVSLMPVPLSPETLPLFDTQSGDDIEVPESLWHLLDAMGREMSEHSDQQSSIDDRLEQVATISTVTLSAGYVAWLLRAGVLSASLLSSMPLWRQIDPLPVLSARAKRRNNNDNNLPEDDKRLENLFEKNNKDRTVPVRGK
ncbi:MAG: Ig-like domain-containing protein [Candidatus Thiodiazotropha sp. 4PDIV1]